MSSLMGLLDLGAGAISAQNAGIATAANNAANVNTPGYSRQRVDLRANAGSPVMGGVTFGNPDRIGDELLAGRQRFVGGSSAYFDELSSSLLDLEGVMTAAEGDIPSGLGEMYGNFNNVASSPLDSQTRLAAIESAKRLAFSFRQQVGEVERAQVGSDERIRDASEQASALMAEIANLNKGIQLAHDPVLVDQRENSALQLAAIVGGKARVDDDGQMRYLLDDGSVLVDGQRAARLETLSDVSLNGLSRIEVVDGEHRRNITDSIGSGTLGADITFRDITEGLIDEIDELAFDLSTQLNAIHRSFAGLDGVTGRDLFVEPTTVEGAAKFFAVDPAIEADPSLLAAGAAGQPVGDNSGMLAMLDTKDQLLTGGGTRTFIDESVRFISNVGQEVRSAKIDQQFHAKQKDSLAQLRDSISGVSLEEEMNRLSQFQHASQANMRFVQTVDQLLGRMIDLL